MIGYRLKSKSPNSGVIDSKGSSFNQVRDSGVVYDKATAEKWVKDHTNVFTIAWYEEETKKGEP